MADMSEDLCYLTNDDLEFQYDALKDVVERNKLLDVPIAIFSIAGSTRTGKSYLLNVLSYLLNNRHNEVDRVENDQFQIPQIFEATRQPNPLTKGICMTSKHIPVEIGQSRKIAVFLMDTQGIEAGEKIECKEADIFTISSTLSYMQIINVKSLLRWKDVDSYTALTLFAKKVQDTMDPEKFTRKATKLFTVVRDWEDPETHAYGNGGGRNYLRTLSRGTSLKKQFECWKSSFASTDCFLVSHPGKKVATTNSKLKSAIDEQTWLEFLGLYQLLFSSNALQEAFNATLKGRDLLRLARELGVRLSSAQRISAPESSFKNYLDLVMKLKITDCLEYYKRKMENFTDLKGNQLKKKHEEVNSTATEMLKNNNSVVDVQEYVDLLHAKTKTQYEIYRGRHILERYAKEWAGNIKKKGNFKTDEVRDFFIKEGSRYIDLLNEEVPDEEARKTIINEFIELLTTLYTKEFERRQENQRIAICCVATAAGLAGGIGVAFIPPVIAGAAAAPIATELAVGMASTVLGVAGASTTGPSSYLIAKHVHKKQDSTAPDLTKPQDETGESEESSFLKKLDNITNDMAQFFSGKKKKQQ